MKEIRKIIELYQQIDFSQRKVALATVVRVEGSSYRRPGAKMLITDDGRWVGAISGGCLEGDALRKARQVMRDGKPMMVTYDTMNDDANSLGVGLGCNGIIDVFIEPIDPDYFQEHSLYFWKQCTTKRSAFIEIKVVKAPESYTGIRHLILTDSDSEPGFINFPEEEQLRQDMNQTWQSGRSQVHTYASDTIEVFIESIQPEIQLIIFGGGYDVPPLVEMAKVLGWHVTVTEDCIAHVAPKRFPGADAVLLVDRNNILSELSFTERTATVLMSHGYKYDKAILEQLLVSDVGYIGVLGPRKRYEKMLGEWEEADKLFDDNRLTEVHSPIGLEIGAETPDEIALAIVSEIQAHFHNKSGTPLRFKQGPIHERILNG